VTHLVNSAGIVRRPYARVDELDWDGSGGTLDPEHHLDDDLLPRAIKRMSTKQMAARAAAIVHLSRGLPSWAGREWNVAYAVLQRGRDRFHETGAGARKVAAEGIGSNAVSPGVKSIPKSSPKAGSTVGPNLPA